MGVLRVKLKDCGAYYVVVEGPRQYIGMVATKYRQIPITDEEWDEMHSSAAIPFVLDPTRKLRTNKDNSTE